MKRSQLNLDEVIAALGLRAKKDSRLQKLIEYLHQKKLDKKVYDEVKERHLRDWVEAFY